MAETTRAGITLLRHGWPSWLWPLGRIVNRHRNPFTGRWHWRAFGG